MKDEYNTIDKIIEEKQDMKNNKKLISVIRGQSLSVGGAKRTFEEIAEEERKELSKKDKIVFVGCDGWPVAGIIGRPITSFIRRLILTRKIMRYKTWLKRGGCKINFNSK